MITVAITAAGIATATIAGPGAAVVVSTLSGAALEGSLSVYDQLQAGGGVDLGRVGISALAGGAKGFTIASPMGALATGVTVGGISASQNITDSVMAGNMSPEALKRAIVTGTVEGATAGGLKWVGNKFEARRATKAEANAKPKSNLTPMSEAELEKVVGGAKDPKWRMNIQSKTGTVWDSIKATQPNYYETQLPKSFEIDLGTQKIWVHGNATEHIYQDIIREGLNINLYSQQLLTDFKGSLQNAVKDGIRFNELISVGNWEFKIVPARNDDLLPALIHAQFNGWGH